MTFNAVPEADAKKLERVAKCYKRKYKNLVFLDRIVESGCKIVEINWRDDGYKDLRSAHASLHKSAQKHGHGLIVFAHGGRLYVANPKLIDADPDVNIYASMKETVKIRNQSEVWSR